ncbi:hypothetical protein OQA88_3331 [Cercophora sp. LCS_1]
MAKGTKKAGAARIAPQKTADAKSRKPKPSKKAEPIVEDNEDEWEDESDEEMADAPAAKATKAKKAATGKHESSDESSDESDGGFDLAALDESDSDSELEADDAGEDDESASEDDQEEEIDVDDLEIENSSDEEEIAATTRVRQTINNKDALLASLRRIALDASSSVPFAFHQSVLSSKPTADAIPSIDDDLQRELAFSNQALEAARRARTLLRKEGVLFTRPTDYFAETVRSDETMEKVKAKMIEEATAKKASAEARKQRDLKKFGKQVQVAKQQERAKQKREALEKIELLKKSKCPDGASSALGANEADDLFDVAVENELKSGSGKKRSFSAGDHGPPNAKRQKKDAKFGFGGKKKHGKSGDAMSSGDLSGFSAKRMKTGGNPGPGGKKKPVKATRPGKARRKAGAGKR